MQIKEKTYFCALNLMMRNIFLAVFSGVLLSVAWPTYGIAFFIFIALVPLLMMEHQITVSREIKKKSWSVFWLSYICFIIWNVCTTGWLYNSQNPDGSPALMAVIFPVLVNSLLMSFTFQLYHWFKRQQNLEVGLVFFIVVWMSFEKLHLEWEFSWPWLNLGNVFAEYPKLIQWYDTIGATGGSFWILVINVLIFYSYQVWQKEQSYRKLLLFLVSIFGLMVVPMAISLYKYYHFNEKPLGKLRVMMFQPNLDPYTEKYRKDSIQIVQELLNLAQNSSEKIDFYIAPETAFPGIGGLSERGLNDSYSIKLIQEFLNKNSQSVFVGGVSTYKVYITEIDKTETSTYYPMYDFWRDDYNSTIQIIPNQEFDIYHKGKLVPGVEIFPYMTILKPLLGNVMLNFGGAVASLGIDKERKSFVNVYNQGKLAPIICYESIYGEYTTEYIKKGANFLAVMTNDSWWGVSEGHRQLLAYARLRAIETRREIARSANSGISAHIDAKGEILNQTLYGEKNTLITDIQLYNSNTLYVKMGDFISKICIGILVLLCIFRIFNRKTNNKG